MTSLTIELSPDLYAQLQREAQRQGKDERLLAQELLAGQLHAAAPVEIPLYVQMMPQIRALLATMNADTLTVPGKSPPSEAIALLRSWTDADAEDDDEGTETWEDVMRSIDANRTSYRKLFPELEQPK